MAHRTASLKSPTVKRACCGFERSNQRTNRNASVGNRTADIGYVVYRLRGDACRFRALRGAFTGVRRATLISALLLEK
mgnify:CR=1 FL=1